MKYLFIVIALFSVALLSAQFSDAWVFSSSTEVYSEITGGTILGTAELGTVGALSLDDVLYTLPNGTMPFSFMLNNVAYNGMTISCNGQVIFGGSTYLGHNPLSSTVVAGAAIAVLGRDLQGLVQDANLLGQIRYEVVGEAPMREFVIQWKNFKKYGTANNNENYNFQLRLQEGTNRFRIAFGSMTVNTTNGNPQIGIRGANNTQFVARTTTTDWTATTAAIVNNATCTLTSTVFPPSGLCLDYNVSAQMGAVDGTVIDDMGAPLPNATISCASGSTQTDASGYYQLSLLAGMYSITASHPTFNSFTQTGIIVLMGITTTVNFSLEPTQYLLNDSFETYPDFAITFAPWTLVDTDLSPTYGIDGYTFENSGVAMAYLILNPSATVPVLTTAAPHSGAKMVACFDSTTPPNNDWLISPQVTGAAQLKFWAKSFNNAYGLERFKVGVSTSGTAPANFTIISGASYMEAPVEWTEYSYNLNTGTAPVYIGIQCVSHDAFAFFVDDVSIIGGAVANEDPTIPMINVELKGNYPNPFNPETTIAYSVKQAAPVSIEIYNIKGQLVKTLLNDIKEPGDHTVVWNGKDNSGCAVSSGVYYYKMNTSIYSSTKKMIIMK
ncbi:MAG: choice-of-anchor J domain-containing protein [Candidatus Cloacimonetes bacterium]|nr:choice-of-anchor J domain-containing protein [Candidatus Cloacimonadota bacterium]